MLPLTLNILTGYVVLSGIFALGFGYVAVTARNNQKRSRAFLIASLLFSSWLVLGPVLFYSYEKSQPTLEVEGRITSVSFRRATERFYSAVLTVQTSSGSDVTIRCSDKSTFLHAGELVKAKYRGKSGELIQAWFYAPSGHLEGTLQNANNWEFAWLIVIGLVGARASIRKYRRDLHRAGATRKATTSS